MTRLVFSRVPGFDTWTGDKRVRSDVRRSAFVCFVIDLDSMTGSGYSSPTLGETKAVADYFVEHGAFPERKV